MGANVSITEGKGQALHLTFPWVNVKCMTTVGVFIIMFINTDPHNLRRRSHINYA